MQTKKIRVNARDNIVKMAALIGLSIFVAQMLGMSMVVSALFACSFLCVTVNYIIFISVRSRLRLDDIMLFWLTLISIILSDWELNFEYYKPAIIVLCSVICIDLCAETEAGGKTCRSIQVLLILVCMITNVMYYGGLRYSYYGTTNWVTLNFNNSNETAMWLLCLIVLLYNSISIRKEIGMKLLPFVCAVSLLPILYSTQSRNCLLVILFFFAGKLFLQLFKIKRFPRWFIFLITAAPILAYVGYMYIFIPYYDQLSKWFLFLLSEGKPLDGRREIWSDLEMNQIKHIVFGNYTVYHKEQLHNSILTLYCRFGVFFVAIVCRKLYKVLKKIQNADMQLALATVWLTGCFETSIFVGLSGMYMLVMLLAIFHKPETNHNKTLKI